METDIVKSHIIITFRGQTQSYITNTMDKMQEVVKCIDRYGSNKIRY